MVMDEHIIINYDMFIIIIVIKLSTFTPYTTINILYLSSVLIIIQYLYVNNIAGYVY